MTIVHPPGQLAHRFVAIAASRVLVGRVRDEEA